MFFSFKILFLLFFLLLDTPLEAKEVKIGLVTTQGQITVGSNTEGELVNLFNNRIITETKNFQGYLLQNINGLISVTYKPSNIKIGAFTGPVKLKGKSKESLVSCNNKWYRGELIVLINGNKKDLTCINNVDLEDYLLSVVPSEIPNGWNKEALKAQVIAARSYTLGYLGRRKEKGYDLESSVEDQVYVGVLSEKKSTTEAVRQTQGEILVDSYDKPLIALYHSSGGGYTDSIENLWDQKPSPHIQPRPDYDDNSPHFKWYRTYKLEEISNLLKDLNVGQLINLEVLSRSSSNRIMYLNIIGTSGKTKIRGENFRRSINLPSSKFNFVIESGLVKFAGRGFGHGLGLSQWGAKALSENGFTYNEILMHYYPGAKLIKIN